MHNPNNERTKRRYFAYLKEAKRHSEPTVDAVAKALDRFEVDTKHRDFKAFHFEQAVAFKKHIAEQTAYVPQGAKVAEFYAGVGAIGLSVLGQAGEIRMNEVSPHSLRGLELGISQLDIADRAKISIIPGAAGATRSMASGAQVVIADPPRKGLDVELTEYLSEQPPERFVYVSCGLESLLSDVLRLTSHGRLRLTALTAFNLLPFTAHVETVACFERV